MKDPSSAEHGATGSESDLRRRILDSARHLLVRGGYQSLSMRRIARKIGYSATSIYLHFESKDELFHALIDEGMGRLHDRLKKAVDARADDPAAQLEGICRSFVRFGLENPAYYEVMFVLRPESMERYPVKKYRRARRNLELLEEVLQAGKDRGLFAAEDSCIAANALWAFLHGMVSLLLSRRVDASLDREAFIEGSVRHVLRSVGAGERVEV